MGIATDLLNVATNLPESTDPKDGLEIFCARALEILRNHGTLCAN
jgi:hypothetical protein